MLITGVTKESIMVTIENETFFLTPLEVFEGIKELQKGLFRWRELTR